MLHVYFIMSLIIYLMSLSNGTEVILMFTMSILLDCYDIIFNVL